MEIRNESGDRDNFTMVPNFVYRLGMSPYAVALYGYIKQAAGEQGRCFKATKTIADELNMSAGSVSGAKDELEQNGLIAIHEVKGPHGGKPLHSIAILDVWQRNAEFIQTHKKERSLYEQANSPSEIASSPSEIIKNPSINNPQNKRESSGQKSPAPPAPPKAEKPAKPKADLFPVASTLSEVCQMPLEINRGRLFREAKQLCAAGVVPPVTPDEIRTRYGAGGWWYREDWRGQKGEPPTPAAIKATWGQWAKAKVIPITRAAKPTKADLLAQIQAQWDKEDGITRDDQSDPTVILEHIPAEGGRSAERGALAAGMG